MVLWEITLATAYFLGLKRTYKLAFKIQRRLISPKYPKLRQFAHQRTRAIFDMAVKVHRTIQERDLAAGRTLGNMILGWLDKMKPSANVLVAPQKMQLSKLNNTTTTKQMQLSKLNNFRSNTTKQAANYYLQKKHNILQRFRASRFNQGSSEKQLFSTARNVWRRSIPSIVMMMKGPNPIGNVTQFRQIGFQPAERYGGVFGGGIRKDIAMWMQQG